MIESLFKFYLANQDNLVKKYNGKYIIITKDGVMGGTTQCVKDMI